MHFKATHVVVWEPCDGQRQAWLVMLADGAAYTRDEWRADVSADLELVNDNWLFRGQATPGGMTGTVEIVELTD